MGQYLDFRGWSLLWPLFVVGLGAVFFAGMVAGGKSAAGLAIPGSIFSVIGLMLLFQSLFGHYEAWAYGWTTIILAVGIGLFIAGTWSGNDSQRQAGVRLAGIGVVLFAVFGSFFELLLFGGRTGWSQIALPVLLILAGLYLVVRRSGLWPGHPPAVLPPDQQPAPPRS